jgi:hypothetical protein
LDHLPVSSRGQLADTDDTLGVVGREDDPGGLDADIGAGSDGDPTSAWARACASLTPSPTIATPLILQLCDLGVFVLGEYLCEDLVDFQLGADYTWDLLGVAGDHRHLRVGAAVRLDAWVRLTSSSRDKAPMMPSSSMTWDRGTLLLPTVCVFVYPRRDVEGPFVEQGGTYDELVYQPPFTVAECDVAKRNSMGRSLAARPRRM